MFLYFIQPRLIDKVGLKNAILFLDDIKKYKSRKLTWSWYQTSNGSDWEANQIEEVESAVAILKFWCSHR